MFKQFVESMRAVNPVLVESVIRGYELCFENENITDDVLFAEYLKHYPNSTREEFETIKRTAPGIYRDIKATLVSLATGKPIIANDGTERAFPFAMDGTMPRPSLEAYEDYNPPHPDEPDEMASGYTDDGLDAESIKQFDADNAELNVVREGDLVAYKNRDGFTQKGKVIHIFKSTAGIDCVSVDSFANTMPMSKVRKI